jgi:hypothetical protein
MVEEGLTLYLLEVYIKSERIITASKEEDTMIRLKLDEVMTVLYIEL